MLPYEHEHQTPYEKEAPPGDDGNRPRPKGDRCGKDHRAMRRARRAQGLGYCVREGPRRGSEGLHQEIREFAATTRGLLLLRDWLASFEVRLVGMEATGVYWKPVYYLLEDDFECWLLNARHLKSVPGRKTDVQDAAWICQLVEHGLVRPSFVPPKEIRE